MVRVPGREDYSGTGFDTDGLLKIDPARKNKPRLALPIIVYIHRVPGYM